MFWIAVDDCDRVIGMVGTKAVSADDMWLKRLFIKPDYKRGGLGSALLAAAEGFAASRGIAVIHTRFSHNYEEAAAFYPAMGFVEAGESEGMRHFVKGLLFERPLA